MPSGPEIERPDDAAIQVAMNRTLKVLTALVTTLGDGEHAIDLVVQRCDREFMAGRADLSIGLHPLRLGLLDEGDFDDLRTLLVFVLEGSTVRDAILVATTAAEPTPRACGWTARDGWLHPINTAKLRSALKSRPEVPTLEPEVYDAPPLRLGVHW